MHELQRPATTNLKSEICWKLKICGRKFMNPVNIKMHAVVGPLEVGHCRRWLPYMVATINRLHCDVAVF